MKFDSIMENFDQLQMIIKSLSYDDYNGTQNLREVLLTRLDGFRAYYEKYIFISDRYPQAANLLGELLDTYVKEFLAFYQAIIQYAQNELMEDAPSPLTGYRIYKNNGIIYSPMAEAEEQTIANIDFAIENNRLDLIEELLLRQDNMSHIVRQYFMSKIYDYIIDYIKSHGDSELEGIKKHILSLLGSAMKLFIFEKANEPGIDENTRMSFQSLLRSRNLDVKDINSWVSIYNFSISNFIDEITWNKKPKSSKPKLEEEVIIIHNKGGKPSKHDIDRLFKKYGNLHVESMDDFYDKNIAQETPKRKLKIIFEEGITDVELHTRRKSNQRGKEFQFLPLYEAEYEIVVPHSAKTIAGFEGLKYLKTIDLSRTGITTIGEGTFEGWVIFQQCDWCIPILSGLEDLRLPPTLKEIGKGISWKYLKRAKCTKKQKEMLKKIKELGSCNDKDTHFDIVDDSEIDLPEIKKILEELIKPLEN